jgi:hypothetical protein
MKFYNRITRHIIAMIDEFSNDEIFETYFNARIDDANDFELNVAQHMNGDMVNIKHSYFKPIKYRNIYLLLDWSLYHGGCDVIIHGFKSYDDMIKKLEE